MSLDTLPAVTQRQSDAPGTEVARDHQPEDAADEVARRRAAAMLAGAAASAAAGVTLVDVGPAVAGLSVARWWKETPARSRPYDLTTSPRSSNTEPQKRRR